MMDKPLPDFLKPKEIEPAQNGADLYGRRMDEPASIEDHSFEPDLVELAAQAQDPLRSIAAQIRALPAELLWKLCDHMEKPEMAKTLVQWAISYLDGTEMPKEGRRG